MALQQKETRDPATTKYRALALLNFSSHGGNVGDERIKLHDPQEALQRSHTKCSIDYSNDLEHPPVIWEAVPVYAVETSRCVGKVSWPWRQSISNHCRQIGGGVRTWVGEQA